MTPERWRLVYDLFREALPLDGAAREALLVSRCAGDPELRDEVERLLTRDQEAEQEDFLAPPELTVTDGVAVAQLSAVHLRCPNCGCGIELVDLMAAQSVQCPTCLSTIPLTAPLAVPWSSQLGANRLDRFELLEAVGTGGFGTVYRAYDPNLQRIVAVKVLRSGNLTAPENLARFLEEARSPAQLRHRAIVPVFDAGEFSGIPYIVREFIRGVTLADSLKLRRPNFDEAARLAAELAEALQYAHENHVIHRDVKPQNVMIDEDGRPHLMDFGMARRDASEITITVEGQVLGTPAYMPPEQARGEAHRVDGRSDIYSLGVVLYQMLTGEVPFRGTTRMLLHQVLHDEPRPPRKLNDRIPRDLETICLKAMAKESSRRYESARELADDLKRFVDRQPIKARPVTALERAWRWCRRNPSLATAIGAAVVSLLAASVLSLLYAVQSKRMLTESNRHLALINFDLGRSACDREDIGPSLHWFSRCVQAARSAGDRVLSRIGRENLAGWLREYPVLQGVYSHDGPVNKVAFSPDGQRALTASFDGTVKLWNIADGTQFGVALKHAGQVWAAAFSPDGKSVATGSFDGTARLWDVASQRLLHVLRHPPMVEEVAFSPDGKTLVTSGEDNFARLWNVATGNPQGKPLEHQQQLEEIAFSPDGRLVLTTSSDRTARLWDSLTGEPRSEPLVHDHEVWLARFSPDGKTFLTASSSKQVRSGEARLWDAATCRLLHTFRHADNIFSMAYSPDAKIIATGSRDKTARLWDAATGRPRGEPLKHDDAVWSVLFSPDGKTLLTGSWDRSARLWDVARAQQIGPPLRHQAAIRSIDFSPGGARVLTGGVDSTARLWETPKVHPAGQPLPQQGKVRTETYNPALDLVLIGTEDGQAVVCSAATGQAPGAPLAHGGRLSTVALSPDGKTALTGSEEGLARLWLVENARPIGNPLSFSARVSAAAFSPDGKIALAASDDGTGRLWDVSTGQVTGALLQHTRPIRAATFLDGKTVVIASEDGMVQRWDAATGLPRGKPMEHPDQVVAMAVSPDGRSLLTGCFDGKARFWNTVDGTLRTEPLRHPGLVVSVAFSPDGRTAATGSDGVALLWDVATGERRGQPMVTEGVVTSIDFSADGNHVVTGGFDQTVRLWDAVLGHPLGPPLRHPGRVHFARFTAHGRSVLSGCEDGTTRIWGIDNADENPNRTSPAGLESITGLRLKDPTAIEVLDTSTWRLRRQQYPLTATSKP